MSRSRVIWAEPCTTAATPPITTKSTPASTSLRSRRVGRNSGQSARGGEGDLPYPGVGVLVLLEPLRRRQAQLLPQQSLIDARRTGRRIELEPASERGEGAPQRVDGDSVPRRLETSYGGLADPESRTELRLRDALGIPGRADQLGGR